MLKLLIVLVALVGMAMAEEKIDIKTYEQRVSLFGSFVTRVLRCSFKLSVRSRPTRSRNGLQSRCRCTLVSKLTTTPSK